MMMIAATKAQGMELVAVIGLEFISDEYNALETLYNSPL